KWLISKGYKMPTGAREALEPYVKSGMKFFVVKVNLERQGKGGFASLRPLQIQFKSPKFMLPIRLGMANAEAVQDMIVYAFSKTGRVETTNYRTLKIPTNREIPYTFKTNGRFTSFYKAVFEKKWKAEGKNGVFLEYAWDLSASNPVKCDPCMAPAITHSDLAEAGVWWLKPGNMGGYSGNLHITRLHVRYSREKFPQDLAFMLTPNKQRFQGRYIVRIPARGPFNCSRAETYLKQLKVRFQKEVAELASLTGWEASGFQSYVASVPHMTTSPAPPKSPRRDIKGGPRVSPGIPSNQLPKVSDIPPMPPKAPLPNSSQPSQVQPETASPDLPAPSSQPGQSGQGTTPLPQVHDKVSAKISGNTHPKEVPGTLPISGILLTLSGLILGIAFFLKQRKPKA
ncbi:MAG TPA: DUF2330 domain-containing protein, partial [Bacteroidetes bacterium]|nr:DUF2330 domain-containing protein [Bacteroidota bacterium]